VIDVRLRTRPAVLDPAPPNRWDAAASRLRRAVDRYYDKVAVMPDRRLRLELRELGTGLTDAVALVDAAARDPRVTHDPVSQRAVARAATLCAHATEAAMLANDASWHGQPKELTRCLDAVTTLVKAIRELTDGQRPRL
jgi:hypothetical protein